MDKSLTELEKLIEVCCGVNIAAYKESFIKRRVEIAVKRLKCNDIDELIKKIREDKKTLRDFFSLFFINVSSFFRNPEIFFYIKDKIVPDLFRHLRLIKVLSAGCSSGEEVYSTAAVLQDCKRKFNFDFTIQGWDILENSIKNAKEAVYPSYKVKEIPQSFRSFFEINGKYLKPVDAIKRKCNFEVKNIFETKGYNRKFNIVVTRNLLIFLKRKYQEKLLSRLFEVMDEFCYLILGKVEKIPINLQDRLELVSPKLRIYKIKKIRR